MKTLNLPYNCILYMRKSGIVTQIANLNHAEGYQNLPDELAFQYVNFYNDQILSTYYDPIKGKFYEDEEKTREIIDPAHYVKPEETSDEQDEVASEQ